MAHTQTAAQTQVIHMSDYDVLVTRKRVKNVNLRVRPDGTVALSAPARVPLYELRRFVNEREDWIARQRACAARRMSLPQGWENGDRVMLLGEPLSVLIVADATVRTMRAEREGAHLVLHVTPSEKGTEAPRRARLVDAWLSAQADIVVRELLPHYERLLERHCSSIRYRRMVSRWGSCNVATGRITLNLELAERPLPCLEAVLVHELCHLRERGHNKQFYALMDACYPSWRTARALLKEAPPRR